MGNEVSEKNIKNQKVDLFWQLFKGELKYSVQRFIPQGLGLLFC